MTTFTPLGAIVHEMLVDSCVHCDSFPCICRLERVWCRCVCGGVIGALADTLEAKYRAVAEHNQTVSHIAWRRSCQP